MAGILVLACLVSWTDSISTLPLLGASGDVMWNINEGQPVHCVETVTGQSLTGTLLLSAETLRVDLYSYADDFHIGDDQSIYLLVETGHVISLHDNVSSGGGTTLQAGRSIHRKGFIANVAVVGQDRWSDADKVKVTSFSVKHTMELLRHKDKVKALGQTRHPREDDLRIFEDAASGMTLGAWYDAIYGMEFDAPKEFWPIFGIEFDKPQSIHDYIRHISNYVEFLSFCLGVKLKPDRIRINRLSHKETMTAVEAGTHIGNHKVYYVWPEEKIQSGDPWVGGSPVRAWDEQELNALRACLVAWMNRVDAWQKPYAMMMTSLALRNVISPERLISACRWLEDIPIARSENAIASRDIEEIATAATQKAGELGHAASIRERIAGAIKWVKTETAEERFTRLVAKIQEKFGKDILPENAVADLKRAIQFRGKSAHGHFNPESDEEFSAFYRSTLAMEAFCFLMTALDLPILGEGLARVKRNPVVRDYLHSERKST